MYFYEVKEKDENVSNQFPSVTKEESVKPNSQKMSDRPQNGSIEVMKFGAPWCKPCRTLKPVYQRVSRELGSSSVSFSDINVDTRRQLTKKYSVKGIPTIVIMKNGSEVDRIVGGISQRALKTRIKSHF